MEIVVNRRLHPISQSRKGKQAVATWVRVVQFGLVMSTFFIGSCAGNDAGFDVSKKNICRDLEMRVSSVVNELATLRSSSDEHSVVAKRQAAMLTALDELGVNAAPAIIRRLDDRRLLAVPYMQVQNTRPGAFEGIAHYSPRLVLDALGIILARSTGKSFIAGADIYNGEGTGQDRDQYVIAWKNYLMSEFELDFPHAPCR